MISFSDISFNILTGKLIFKNNNKWKIHIKNIIYQIVFVKLTSLLLNSLFIVVLLSLIFLLDCSNYYWNLNLVVAWLVFRKTIFKKDVWKNYEAKLFNMSTTIPKKVEIIVKKHIKRVKYLHMSLQKTLIFFILALLYTISPILPIPSYSQLIVKAC